MITASGNVESAPQTLFILANQDNFQVSPAKLVGSTANLFMGLQLQCAECHVHPTTDAWKPDDFWSLAAFFGHTVFERDDPKVARGPVVAVREVARKAEPKGKAAKMGAKAIPPTDTIAIPDPTDAKKTIGTARARLFESDRPANLGSNVPYRPRLAAWLTAPDNKYFARATVNRFWAHLFARGLIHPVEDMGPDSVASHPELLDALAGEFAASGFDVKFLLRAYCNSDAYHRTSRPTSANADDETLLSRMPIKVIGARELLASLQVATDSRAPALSRDQAKALRKEMAKNKGLNAPAGGVRFFDKREYEDEVTDFSYGIPQMLKLMNTPLTNAGATVARLGKPNRDRADVVVDLYLAALTRKPTERELDRLLAYLDQKPATGYADIFWSLLNCAEFVSNH
jgi:hypothetical protein